MPGRLSLIVEGVAFGAAILGLAASHASPAAQATADYSAVAPIASSPGPLSPDRHAEFVRAPDGLFYVTALVNGRAVRFLIDTGASVVMLTREDAERVGVGTNDGSFGATVATANGPAAMAWTKLKRIDVAGLTINEVDAAVPRSGLPVSLLGQNALGRLGEVTLNGDRLKVRVPVGSD